MPLAESNLFRSVNPLFRSVYHLFRSVYPLFRSVYPLFRSVYRVLGARVVDCPPSSPASTSRTLSVSQTQVVIIMHSPLKEKTQTLFIFLQFSTMNNRSKGQYRAIPSGTLIVA